MYFWYRLCFISVAIALWPIEDRSLLINPIYWLTAGLLIAGVSSEPLWKTRFSLYTSLALIASAFTLLYGLEFGWVTILVFIAFSFYSANVQAVVALLSCGMLVIVFFTMDSSGANLLSSLILATLVVAFASNVFRQQQVINQKHQRVEELAYEKRVLKRQLIQEEDAVKQAERTRIARDVHDSVGHQLTALVMQLQMAELKESGDNSYIIDAKQTARTALEEMRKAVKALEKEEVRGVSMIVRLIRKLEAESQVYVSFKTESGALSQALNDEQSTALYRFVQEGLTNAMRHTFAKQISVELSIIGGHTYIATVSNEAVSSSFSEGFGLSQLRKRFEHLNGTFTATYSGERFMMRGAFPIGETKQENDIDR